MSQSHYEVQIGLGFDTSSEARAAAQAEAAIRDVLRRMQAASQGAGAGQIIDPKQIARLGEELERVVQRAFNLDIRNSPLFKQMSNVGARTPGMVSDQQLVRGVQPNNAAESALLRSQQQLALATIAREKVYARNSLGIGGEAKTKTLSTGDKFLATPYADETTAREARISAERRYVAATESASKARDKFVTDAVAAERALEVAKAREITAINARAKREEKEARAAQTSQGSGILAIQRRAEQDAKRQRADEEKRARENVAIQRRADEDARKAAVDAADRLRKQQADAARRTSVSYPDADTGTRVGRAQATVNIAERSYAAARLRQAEIAKSETATGTQVLQAENLLASTTRGLDAARARLRDESTRAGIAQRTEQRGGTLRGQFALGFQGASDRPFAEQIGQAFKFSAFYGTAYKALFALSQTFQQTLQEGIQFQQAVTELRLATGRTKDEAESLAKSFGESASDYASAGDAAIIGARAQGYYGTTEADAETQRRVGETSARVVSQIAFSSGLQAADIQGNLAAVAQAYQLGPQSQQYIGDLDAYFSRKFGITQGASIEASSQAGVVGRAAGFSPAEVTALAADVISRTSASPAAAGGYLTQIFTRAGEGQLTALNSKYGIDNNQDFASQFRALAKVYADQPDQRDDISAVFGRGKSQAAAISILQDFANITENVKKAEKEAPGTLQESSDLRLKDVGGQIQATILSLKELANQASQSGLLDFVGAAVVVLRDLADAGSAVLGLFNEMPHVLRDLILALGAATVASRISAASEAGVAAGGALPLLASRIGARGGFGFARSAGGLYAEGAIGAGGRTVGGIAAGQRIFTNAAGSVIPYGAGAGVGNNLRTAGGVLRGGLNAAGGFGVLAAFAGSAVLLSKTMEVTKKFNTAREDYIDFALGKDYDLTTSDGAAAAADQAKNLANQNRDAADGFLAKYKNLGDSKDQALDLAKRADADAKLYTANAKALAAAEASGTTGGGLITDFSEEGISAALDAVTRSGGNAASQMNLLVDSLNHTGDAARRAKEGYQPTLLSQKYGSDIFKDFSASPGFVTGSQDNLGDFADEYFHNLTFGLAKRDKNKGYTDTTDQTFAGLFSATDLQDRLRKGLSTITSIDELADPEKYASVVQEVVGDLPETAGKKAGFGPDIIASIRTQLEASVSTTLDNIKSSVNNIATVQTLTQEDLTNVTSSILSILQNRLSGKDDSDYTGRQNAIRNAIQALKTQIATTPGGEGNAAARDGIRDLRSQIAANRFKELEGMRAVAEQQVGGADAEAGSPEAAARDRQLAAISRRFARKEIRSAIKNRSGDVLADAISNSGKSSVAYARQAIEDAMKIALAAAEVKAQAEAVASAVASGNIRLLERGPGGLGDQAAKKIKRPFQKLLNVLGTTASQDDPSTSAGAAEEGDTAAEIRAAKAAAEAARKGGGLASAASDIVAAKAALEDAKPGTVAYFNALASLYTAQQSLTQAVIAYRKNQYLLGHDATNPLVQARAETYAAAQQLNADRKRGAGKDVLAEDRVALQSAQASQEQTKFQQRLDAVTTADDLGRISHSKYLAYLDHEHDRLNGIKNRTYQQQEQLDQIDKLMKDAASELDGQFNFGDIKLPTPYQVRRTIAERMDGIGANIAPARQQVNGSPKAGSAQYVTFNIDGADTAKVEKIVRTVVGGNNTINVRTNAARRIR